MAVLIFSLQGRQPAGDVSRKLITAAEGCHAYALYIHLYSPLW